MTSLSFRPRPLPEIRRSDIASPPGTRPPRRARAHDEPPRPPLATALSEAIRPRLERRSGSTAAVGKLGLDKAEELQSSRAPRRRRRGRGHLPSGLDEWATDESAQRNGGGVGGAYVSTVAISRGPPGGGLTNVADELRDISIGASGGLLCTKLYVKTYPLNTVTRRAQQTLLCFA